MNMLKNIAITLALVTGACGVEPATGIAESDLCTAQDQLDGVCGPYVSQVGDTWAWADANVNVYTKISIGCTRISSVRVDCHASISTPAGSARIDCEISSMTGTSCTVH